MFIKWIEQVLAESAEGRRALLQNAGTMFHVRRQMMGDDDAVCSDASLLYLALQEQADGRYRLFVLKISKQFFVLIPYQE